MSQQDSHSSEPPPIISTDMLILGRESRGLTQIELAGLLGVSQGRISKIEKGLLPVPDDLLDLIADALHRPRHFFYEGSRVGIGVAEIFHRKRADVPQRILSKVY